MQLLHSQPEQQVLSGYKNTQDIYFHQILIDHQVTQYRCEANSLQIEFEQKVTLLQQKQRLDGCGFTSGFNAIIDLNTCGVTLRTKYRRRAFVRREWLTFIFCTKYAPRCAALLHRVVNLRARSFQSVLSLASDFIFQIPQ